MRCLKSVLIKLNRENDVPRNSLSYQVIPSQPTVLGCFHSTHDCCMTLANALTKNHRARSNINSRDLCCLVLCSCIPVSFSRASAAHRLDIILSLAFFRSLALVAPPLEIHSPRDLVLNHLARFMCVIHLNQLKFASISGCVLSSVCTLLAFK